MQKKKRGKKWLVVLLIMAVAAAAAYFARECGLISFPSRAGSASAGVESLDTQTAYIGTIKVTTEGNGIIEPSDKQTFTSAHTVEIERVEVEEGDIVSEGDLLATIDVGSIDDRIEEAESELADMTSSIKDMTKGGSSSVTATVAGRVKRIFAKKGDLLSEVVRKHGGVMELSVDGKLKVEFTSAKKLSVGSTVTVSFLSYEEEGTVVERDGNAYTVTISDSSSYQVDAAAEILDDDDEVIGEGVLMTNTPYLVDTKYGVCDGINVSVGDSVDSGATLLTRTSVSYNADYTDAVNKRNDKIEEIRALRDLRDEPEILAPMDGIVSELLIADRQTAAEDAPMYTLISTDSYWLKAQIDELDIAGVEAGQEAAIVFDAFDDEEYEGEVEKVSALGTNTGGVTTYTVTIRMNGVEKVKPGMSATATITLEEKNDALLVPVDAVRTVDGERKVTVVNGGATEEKTVSLGLVNSSLAEITDGVSEGQEVVVYTSDATDWMVQMMQRNGRAGGAFGGAGEAG